MIDEQRKRVMVNIKNEVGAGITAEQQKEDHDTSGRRSAKNLYHQSNDRSIVLNHSPARIMPAAWVVAASSSSSPATSRNTPTVVISAAEFRNKFIAMSAGNIMEW